MRTHRTTGGLMALVIALAILLATAPSEAATLTCGTANGLAGQSVTVSLTASDLTGLAVKSYQFELGYAPSVVTATAVQTAGTLTAAAAWATPTFSVVSGRIRVSAAGTTPLTGAGVLLKITFLIDPLWINGSYTGLTLSNAVFNEGTPAVVTTNGSITANATPQITVYPDVGEIAIGQSLQFNVSGSVAAPVAWSTTDPTIATISSGGLLTGVAPGLIRVNALDAAGHADQSDGNIAVRAAVVTVGTTSSTLGHAASVPVITSSLTGAGVRAGQFQVSWNNAYLTLNSATRPVGTLLNGYGSFNYGVVTSGTTSTVTVDFAGTTDLAGADTLFVLNFTTSPTNYGTIGLTLLTALYNETLPALRVNGSIVIASPSSFSVSPNAVTLLAAQAQTYTTVGTVVPPITWTSLNPAVATMGYGGVLTAKASGVTQVKAVDAAGGTAVSGDVTVYDLRLSLGSVIVAPGAVAHVPLLVDRDITPLNVRSLEYVFGWPTTYVTSVTPTTSGMTAVWGAPVTKPALNNVRVVNAGVAALTNTSTLEIVDVAISASTPTGTDIPVTLSGVYLNEGKPLPLVTNTVIRVRSGTTAVEPEAGLAFALTESAPNPATTLARLAFTLPSAGASGMLTRLEVFGPDGRRVRRLIAEPLGAGRHEVVWDLRRDDGSPVAPGIYFTRLEWGGQRTERKLTVIR